MASMFKDFSKSLTTWKILTLRRLKIESSKRTTRSGLSSKQLKLLQMKLLPEKLRLIKRENDYKKSKMPKSSS